MSVTLPLAKLEGKYEILEKIQEGGMGAIYKVRHLLLDEIRVVKVMKPQLAVDEKLKRRFINEAKLAKRLRAGNIAQLYDFVLDEDGVAYIVM
jgi:serine/threonine-protein kinase